MTTADDLRRMAPQLEDMLIATTDKSRRRELRRWYHSQSQSEKKKVTFAGEDFMVHDAGNGALDFIFMDIDAPIRVSDKRETYLAAVGEDSRIFGVSSVHYVIENAVDSRGIVMGQYDHPIMRIAEYCKGKYTTLDRHEGCPTPPHPGTKPRYEMASNSGAVIALIGEEWKGHELRGKEIASVTRDFLNSEYRVLATDFPNCGVLLEKKKSFAESLRDYVAKSV